MIWKEKPKLKCKDSLNKEQEERAWHRISKYIADGLNCG